MTDKEKISAKVARLQKRAEHNFDISLTENERQFWLGESNVLTLIGKYIDSLQEEPETKFKIGDRIRLKGTTVKGDTIIKIYTSEVGNTYFEFKNSGDASADLDWELVEEPKKCMFTKEEFTEEDRKILCEDCEEECEYAKKEEPVSIWHDASEKPELDDLLIETNDRRIIHRQSINNYGMVKRWAYCKDILNLSNVERTGKDWKEEPVSGDLGEYINELSKQFPEVSFAKLSRIAVRVAKWQKENLWKHADGDDLPEIDREVVVFTQNFPDDAGIMSVSIAHRPNPNGFDGKSLTSGKVEHYTPETYDKGGWNIPDVKFWLDVELPKEIE